MERSPLATHFVWIGPRLPYYARLAIESALVAMPDGVVHVHYVGRTATGEHADAVSRYPRVLVHAATLGDYFNECPGGNRAYLDVLAKIPNGSPAAISNLVRLAVLWRYGGVYLDTDVIVVRGLHDPADHGAYLGCEQVWAGNRRRVEHGLGLFEGLRAVPWALTRLVRRSDSRLFAGRAGLAARLPEPDTRLQVNNAVLAAPPGSQFLAAALGRALTVDPTKRFALGPSLLDDLVADQPRLARVVPPSRFYAVPPGQSYRWFEDASLRLRPDAQVVHYVASNHRRVIDGLGTHDPRCGTRSGLFWRLAGDVQAAVAAGQAGTRLPNAPLLGRAG